MTGVQTCALPICFPVTIREAATWEVRNITVDGKCNQTQLDPPVFDAQSKVYAAGGIIKVENKQAMPVTVFDVTGRILYSVPAIQNTEFEVMQQGIYIVRCGNKVVKVVLDWCYKR